MNRLVRWLLACVFAVLIAAGCGGDTAKGVNKDKDKPKAAEKPAERPG